MSSDLAKEAAEARANLQCTLATCSEALREMAEVFASVSTELAAATAREQAATTAYVTALERQITRQAQLS